MSNTVTIVGAGLAGSEAALNLASRGISVRLVEMRPAHPTAVHHTGDAAELVCSNSLKSTKPDSAAGLLKAELATLGSPLIAAAKRHAVAAGGALAVDRDGFSSAVSAALASHPLIDIRREEIAGLPPENWLGLDFACGEATRIDLHDWGTVLRWFNRSDAGPAG